MLVSGGRGLCMCDLRVLMDGGRRADRDLPAGSREGRAAGKRREKEDEALHAHDALQIPDHLSRIGPPREKQ